MPINLGDYDNGAKAEVVVASATPMEKSTKEDLDCMHNFPVAMAYVVWQKWQKPYDLEKAFNKGTIFPDLNLPFTAYEGGRGK